MNARSYKLVAGLVIGLLCTSSTLFAASPPHPNHNIRRINGDGTYTYYYMHWEYYVKDTLPNEWIRGWTPATLQAGAVIIRSGVFWRINRSYLNYGYPYNNCYQGTAPLQDGSIFEYYRTVPQTLGGQEQWILNSRLDSTSAASSAAVDATQGIHAELVSIPSGRPDAFLPHRYNATIQNRTSSCAGVYYEKIRCAVLNYGSPIDPNVECSETGSYAIDLTTTNPRYIQN